MVMGYNRFLKLTVTPLFLSFPADTAYIERTLGVQKTSKTSSVRLMYVQFTSYVYGVFCPLYNWIKERVYKSGLFQFIAWGVKCQIGYIFQPYFSPYTADYRKVLNKLSGREHLMLRSLVTFSPTAFMNMCIIQFFNI